MSQAVLLQLLHDPAARWRNHTLLERRLQLQARGMRVRVRVRACWLGAGLPTVATAHVGTASRVHCPCEHAARIECTCTSVRARTTQHTPQHVFKGFWSRWGQNPGFGPRPRAPSWGHKSRNLAVRFPKEGLGPLLDYLCPPLEFLKIAR